MGKFQTYQRKSLTELRPYEQGENMAGISISNEDAKNESPKLGDMIARNPNNHADQWLVSAEYFKDNFAPLGDIESQIDASLDMNIQCAKNGQWNCLLAPHQIHAAKYSIDEIKNKEGEIAYTHHIIIYFSGGNAELIGNSKLKEARDNYVKHVFLILANRMQMCSPVKDLVYPVLI